MTDGYAPQDYEERKYPGSNGLNIKDGYLYICQHLSGKIVRTRLKDVIIGSYIYDNTIEIVAETYGGKRFNSPNDLVFDSNGDLWFTDTTCGLQLLDSTHSEIQENCL